MSAFGDRNPQDQRALEAAAAWQSRLSQDSSLELSPEFSAWIADAGNRRALQAVNVGLAAVQMFGTSPELLGLRSRAMARAHRANVIRWMPRRLLFRAASVALLAALIGGGAAYFYLTAAASYETGVGVRRLAALSDGSRISLDSNTEVHVRYSDTARKIVLDRGRARFDVAHDPTRPFSVRAGTQTVVAIGTSFAVEVIGDKVLVTLIQGHVVVKSSQADSPKQKPKAAVSLKAGEELVAAQGVVAQIQPVNLRTAVAWEAGQLIFKDVTLLEAAERENRYTDKPVVVDPSVATIRISGVFNAGDVNAFVSSVTAYLPVQATTTSDDRILLQKRS